MTAVWFLSHILLCYTRHIKYNYMIGITDKMANECSHKRGVHNYLATQCRYAPETIQSPVAECMMQSETE